MPEPLSAAGLPACTHPVVRRFPFVEPRTGAQMVEEHCYKCGAVLKEEPAQPAQSAQSAQSIIEMPASSPRRIPRIYSFPERDRERIERAATALRAALLNTVVDPRTITGELSPWAWAYAEAVQGERERRLALTHELPDDREDS